VPLEPVTLPDVVVPVMAAIAVAPEVAPEKLMPELAPTPDAPALDGPELALAPDAPAFAPEPELALAPEAVTRHESHDAPSPANPVMPLAIATALAQAPDKAQVMDPGQDVGVERARSTMAQRIGDDAERLAAIRLEALGWQILARNLRVSRAEIDLLAIDPGDPPTLVVVEVRRRSRRDFGLAEETVDFRKRATLRRAAGELAMRSVLPDGRRIPALPVRIDLIAIDRGPDGRPALRHHRGIET